MQLYILIRSLFPGAPAYLWWVAPFCKSCGEAVNKDRFPPSAPYPFLTLHRLFCSSPSSLNAHFCVAKPKTQQSEREKCHVHSGDIAMRKEIWEFCSSLISLWDLLGVVLRLGFPSMHFRPLKLSFLTSKIVIFLHSCQLSDQWHLLRVPGLKLWLGAVVSSPAHELCVLQSSNNCTGHRPHTGFPFPPQFHWTSTDNSPSFHRTSGNEVCSCWLTGKCWLGQGRWDEKIHREEKWCEKN